MQRRKNISISATTSGGKPPASAPSTPFEEAIPVSARDRSGHSRLGREMVVDTGALDADLGCKIAEAEAPVARLADASLGQVHQALCRFVHRISDLY